MLNYALAACLQVEVDVDIIAIDFSRSRFFDFLGESTVVRDELVFKELESIT